MINVWGPGGEKRGQKKRDNPTNTRHVCPERYSMVGETQASIQESERWRESERWKAGS